MEAPADVGWRLRELSHDGGSVLVEVGPALVVDRDGGAGPDQPAQLDGLLGGHGVADRPGDRKAYASQVEQGGVHLEAVGDLADAVVQHGVAGDPQNPLPLALPAQSKADNVADDRAAERWAVAARGGRDLDGGPSQGLQLGGRPGLEAAGVAAQSAGPVGGGEDDAGRREQGAAGGVEVVAVAEQDRVDWAMAGGGDRRAGQLRELEPQPNV